MRLRAGPCMRTKKEGRSEDLPSHYNSTSCRYYFFFLAAFFFLAGFFFATFFFFAAFFFFAITCLLSQQT